MKHLKVVFIAVLLLSLFAVNAMAEESDESTKTEASITFVANDETATEPKNPDNPDLSGEEGSGTGMNGKLTLDYLPNFNFGSRSINPGVQTFHATNLKPYIQVTDKRATGEGWKVQVKLSEFTGENGTFSGVITLSNGENVKPSSNNSAVPSAISPVTVTSKENEVNVVIASDVENAGMGTWLTRWYPTTGDATDNDSVKLTVNTSNIIAGSYTATLDWILTNAP